MENEKYINSYHLGNAINNSQDSNVSIAFLFFFNLISDSYSLSS